MADNKKISELNALAQADIATSDEIEVVDKSDTTMGSGGTNKKFTWSSLKGAIRDTEINNETPSGAIDSSNKVYTLANTPSPAASLKLFLNGMYQTPGGEDYTLATATITFVVAPPTGSILRAFYTK